MAISPAKQATQKKFPFPYNDVFDGVVAVISTVGFNLKSQDRVIGRIAASTRPSLASHGENLAIVVEKVDDSSTQVSIESKLKIGWNAFGAVHEKNFNRLFEALGSYLSATGSSASSGSLTLLPVEESSAAIAVEQPSAAIPVVCIRSSGYSLPPKTLLHLTASQVGLGLSVPGTSEPVEIPFAEIDALEFEGGAVQKGGGFTGGGFGLAGFAIGAVSAMALNKLTTKTEIHSQIRILTAQGEVVLYTNVGTPQYLEVALADARTNIRNAQRIQPSTAPSQAAGSLSEQLAQLAELHRSGALSDAEFQAAKTRLLG